MILRGPRADRKRQSIVGLGYGNIPTSISLFACILLFGCAHFRKKPEGHLSQVAKGWCLNIRASQVIPVYPLSEDVRVGDMYIVQYPIEDEVALYEKEGFLPLTHLIGRLPLRWTLTSSLLTNGAASTPERLAAKGEKETGASNVAVAPKQVASTTNLTNAVSNSRTPQSGISTRTSLSRAAFPSYSFLIDRSIALNMGLPVEGVPVAFGLLGAKRAQATVTLSDAYTFGLEESPLYEAVRAWVATRTNLLEFTPRYIRRSGQGAIADHYTVQYNFLRVISRVYLVGSVNVSVTDASSVGGDAAAGLPTTASLLTNSDSYQHLLERLNSGLVNTSTPLQELTSSVPSQGSTTLGGRLKFASIVNRSVSMQETFDRPLVIGYLAFDIPIGFAGELGDRPIATQVRLSRRAPSQDVKYVKRWAVESPTAPNDLIRWAGGMNSATRVWLRENGLPEYVEDRFENQQRSEGLYSYLRGGKRILNLLAVRLVSEVIEKPDGLTFSLEDPLDERTHMKDLATAATNKTTGSALLLATGRPYTASYVPPSPREKASLANYFDITYGGPKSRAKVGPQYVELFDELGYLPVIPPNSLLEAGDIVRISRDGSLITLARRDEVFEGLKTKMVATEIKRLKVFQAGGQKFQLELFASEVQSVSLSEIANYLSGQTSTTVTSRLALANLTTGDSKADLSVVIETLKGKMDLEDIRTTGTNVQTSLASYISPIVIGVKLARITR